MSPRFQWDPDKAAANFRKHGVSFDRAISAFKDPRFVEWPDEDVDYGEPRFVYVGMTDQATVVTVIYTERDDSIRIISARKASRYEEKRYRDELGH
jgi:uncharacterized DUF497 family protein